ncbi:MAG TPA: hypothetical protein VFO80_03560 [Sphingomonas sp.]|nr:hypothetical protein [Sphingomonas sp.]
MKSIALLAALVVAGPAVAQSDKPMTKAGFEKQQTRKYERYDVNKDGTVTAEEIMQVRPTKKDGTPYTLESTRKSLAKRDANGDGTVTIAEAVASEMPRFDKLDADKDGTVTAAERDADPK